MAQEESVISEVMDDYYNTIRQGVHMVQEGSVIWEILDDYYDTMRQGIHIAQEEPVIWEESNRCDRKWSHRWLDWWPSTP